jgi:alpha-glucosidase
MGFEMKPQHQYSPLFFAINKKERVKNFFSKLYIKMKENLVIYQIYPRSFKDSNNDGIGDIKGIIEKIDYIKDLGVDGIWLSPINQSPMFDFGYDISDYRAIDPIFGTEKDFDLLIAACHKRELMIMMDLVINHSSHLHQWFIESRSSKNNPKRDWYIWHPGKKSFLRNLFGMKPASPNNWLAMFGGNAWEWDKKTQEFYLHLFLKEQPDLNWRNPQLKQAVFGEIKYWLDKGIDGFRIDVVNMLLKNKELKNNPFRIGKTPRPYDLQNHIYDRNQDELNGVLKELRELMNQYESRFIVGEVFDEQGNPELSAKTLGNGLDQIHTAFDFSLIYTKFNAKSFHQKIKKWLDVIPENGTACHVFSNHDQPRVASRIKDKPNNDEKKKFIALLLLTLKGHAYIYYGDEIGMTDGKIKRSEIKDPVGKMYWPFHLGRDPQRTPMQWNEQKNAGFSQSKPWLPVSDNHKTINTNNQEKNAKSLLHFYKQVISLRKNQTALISGKIKLFEPYQNTFFYIRENENQKLLITLNFDQKNQDISQYIKQNNIDFSKLHCLYSSKRKENESIKNGDKIILTSYEATVWEIKL